MGRRGPKKTPTAILKLRGSHHLSDRKGEALDVPGDPVRPAVLDGDGEACAMWDRMCSRMRGQQILSEAWAETLGALCLAWGRLVRAEVEAAGQPLVNDDGRKNQVHSIAREIRDEFSRLARDFGLTPASKADVKASDKTPQRNSKSRHFA